MPDWNRLECKYIAVVSELRDMLGILCLWLCLSIQTYFNLICFLLNMANRFNSLRDRSHMSDCLMENNGGSGNE